MVSACSYDMCTIRQVIMLLTISCFIIYTSTTSYNILDTLPHIIPSQTCVPILTVPSNTHPLSLTNHPHLYPNYTRTPPTPIIPTTPPKNSTSTAQAATACLQRGYSKHTQSQEFSKSGRAYRQASSMSSLEVFDGRWG